MEFALEPGKTGALRAPLWRTEVDDGNLSWHSSCNLVQLPNDLILLASSDNPIALREPVFRKHGPASSRLNYRSPAVFLSLLMVLFCFQTQGASHFITGIKPNRWAGALSLVVGMFFHSARLNIVKQNVQLIHPTTFAPIFVILQSVFWSAHATYLI